MEKSQYGNSVCKTAITRTLGLRAHHEETSEVKPQNQSPRLGKEKSSSWMPLSVGIPSKMMCFLGATNFSATFCRTHQYSTVQYSTYMTCKGREGMVHLFLEVYFFKSRTEMN